MRALAASAAGTFLPECPEEQSFVGGACADTCQEMAQEIALRVAELLRALVVEALHIEMKATPVEAFHRSVCIQRACIHRNEILLYFMQLPVLAKRAAYVY
jgi:hypothetical protein